MRKMNDSIPKCDHILVGKKRKEKESAVEIIKEKADFSKEVNKSILCESSEISLSRRETEKNTSPNNFCSNKKKNCFDLEKVKKEKRKVSKWHTTIFPNEENVCFQLYKTEKNKDLKKETVGTTYQGNYINISEIASPQIKNSICYINKNEKEKEKENCSYLLKCNKIELTKGMALLSKHKFRCTFVVIKKRIPFLRNRKKNNKVWKNRLWKKILKCVLCDTYNIDCKKKFFKIKHVPEKTKKKKEDKFAKKKFEFPTCFFSGVTDKTDYTYFDIHNSNNKSDSNLNNSFGDNTITSVKSEKTNEKKCSINNVVFFLPNKNSKRKKKLYATQNEIKKDCLLFFLVHKDNILNANSDTQREKKVLTGELVERKNYFENIKNELEKDSQKDSENILEKREQEKYDVIDKKSLEYLSCGKFTFSLTNSISSNFYFLIDTKNYKKKDVIIRRKNISKKYILDELLMFLLSKSKKKMNKIANSNVIINNSNGNVKNKRLKKRFMYLCYLIEMERSTFLQRSVQGINLPNENNMRFVNNSEDIMFSDNSGNTTENKDTYIVNKENIETNARVHNMDMEPMKEEGSNRCFLENTFTFLSNEEKIYPILNKDSKKVKKNKNDVKKNCHEWTNFNRHYPFCHPICCCEELRANAYFTANFTSNDDKKRDNFHYESNIFPQQEDWFHEKREDLKSEMMNVILPTYEKETVCFQSLTSNEHETIENDSTASIFQMKKEEKEKHFVGLHLKDEGKKQRTKKKKKFKEQITVKHNVKKRRTLMEGAKACNNDFLKKTNLSCFKIGGDFLNSNKKNLYYNEKQKRSVKEIKKAVSNFDQIKRNIKKHASCINRFSFFYDNKKRRNRKQIKPFFQSKRLLEEPFFELVETNKSCVNFFDDRELEIEMSKNKKYILKKNVINAIMPHKINKEEVILKKESLMNNRLINDSMLYEKDSSDMISNKKKKKKITDDTLNDDLPSECIDALLQSNCENNQTYVNSSSECANQRKNINLHMYSNSNSNSNSNPNSNSNTNSYNSNRTYSCTNYENSCANSYEKSVERSVDKNEVTSVQKSDDKSVEQTVNESIDQNTEKGISGLVRNIDLDVDVMERHSSILVNRGIKTKKYVDYSLYNTYAKSSFLQCAEQADNHFIGNYLVNFQDENFSHIRQKIKLCLSRTFANLKTTSETCVLHFTNLIFDLYISKFGSKREIIDSIISEITTEEKQFSDVMIQLLKEFYPKIYNEFVHNKKLKNKFKLLYEDLESSCDLIYHFIAVICLFISQKYYNYRLISIDLIANTYCKSHLEGLTKIYSVTNELIKESSPDYYSVTQYLDATFSAHSVNKCFALEVEICILKKLNYDLSIPTAYSLLDSLLKANENVNFLKVRNDYNITEGEILLRVASIDNNFLKYKASTLAMAIYEILSFNICKEKMQINWIPDDNEDMFSGILTMPHEKGTILKPKIITEESSFAIAEEEQRLILATRYLNEKSKLHKIIKKIILKTCIAIKKKIPKYYHDYDHHLTEEIKSYISTYKESKKNFLRKLKEKQLSKKITNTLSEKNVNSRKIIKEESKDEGKSRVQSHTTREAIVKGERKEAVSKISEQNDIRMDLNKVKMKLKKKQKKLKKKEQGGKMERRDKQQEAEIFGKIENKNKTNEKKKNKKKKKILLLTYEEKEKKKKSKEKKKQINKNNSEYRFNVCKNKVVKKLKKYLKKISRFNYPTLPKKFCSSYILQGDEIMLYLKMDPKNENTVNKMNDMNIHNTSSNEIRSRDRQGKYVEEQVQDTSYIIGSRTKSTDGHLTYYFNYINKLRSRLMHGLKYALKRINKIKKKEIRMVTTNLRELIKRKKIKKMERKKVASLKIETKDNIILNRDKTKLNKNKMKHKNTIKIKKNISLLKQLHYEIKTLFLWLNKVVNIEIRPLLKFTDLRYLHQANRYKKCYFKHVKKIIESIKEMKNVKEIKKNVKEEKEEDQTKRILEKAINDRRNRTLMRTNINMGGDINNNAYMQRSEESRAGKNIHENILKDQKPNVPNINDDFLKQYVVEVRKSIIEDEKWFHSYCEKIEKPSQIKDIEKTVEEKAGRRQRPRSSRKRRNEQPPENTMNLDSNKKVRRDATREHIRHEPPMRKAPDIDHNIQMNDALKNHIFQMPPTVQPIRKTQNDWITINDPQVDECARELMECFLKWKNSDFISKNWTYSEYTHCKDYYYSLVFGDLKSPEALKGINEMMNMKYIHLLNIYYDSNLRFLCDYG